MSKTPAKRSKPAEGNTNGPDVGELAARLFVNHYKPGSGRTAEYCAKVAIEAAEAFVKTYTTIANKE